MGRVVTTEDRSDEMGIGRRLAAWTRYVILIPVLGLFIGAIVLIAVAFVETIRLVIVVIRETVEMKEVLVGFIELADVFLLAIVLYIIALGLFELFVDDRLPLPSWLAIHSLEDLKEKLISVVAVVLGVLFLGKAIDATDYLQVLYLGGGIALVIAALGYFTGQVILRKDK